MVYNGFAPEKETSSRVEKEKASETKVGFRKGSGKKTVNACEIIKVKTVASECPELQQEHRGGEKNGFGPGN